jgi:hypothetical protein
MVVLGAENVRLLILDVPKKAVTAGTVVGVQLLALLKLLLTGTVSQVASWAAAGRTATSIAEEASSPARNEASVRRARNVGTVRRSPRARVLIVLPLSTANRPLLGRLQQSRPCSNNDASVCCYVLRERHSFGHRLVRPRAIGQKPRTTSSPSLRHFARRSIFLTM